MSETPVKDAWTGVKEWYTSKTIIGIAITLISTVIKFWLPEADIDQAVDEVLTFGDEVAPQIDNLWLTLTQLAGLALAAYGRFKAKIGLK